MSEASGNNRAVSVRISSANVQKASGQRRHDLRIGTQPNYVKTERSHLNRVLIAPETASKMRGICKSRRELRNAERAIKRTASVVTRGIITFGSQAARIFEQLPVDQQDAAFKDLAQTLATKLGTSLHGLVVHCDEATVHAHFQLAGYDRNGIPLSQTTRPAILSGFQDLAADVMRRHCPGIERGRRYGDRIAAGATYAETVHRTVRQLHRDLIPDFEKAQLKLSEARERCVEMQARVDKLTKKKVLSEKEVKRLEIYKARLNERNEVRTEQLRKALSMVEKLLENTSISEETRKAAEQVREIGRETLGPDF